ncbi:MULTISPECIES: NAD/NADP-dependent octopine/nopaline dehydrogenase family protein [unclassified Chelatococcus]|uniref:NAD/NADP-dependent octopine/nopaline dehydrogenase family protein n=1 Tax=unclassified Chelatococcus TaxID=2638111 RepID=UPI001BCFF7AC|nr:MULTISPECIES: NAD/NADP-dependent octopine/nopaline dehydrogenase family protein [unclassified Chelatococcus]MBS7697334.1 NAD/NADP octopine/nopaline dehydrogenase family protein [Chelatococcus sp. YT9]MBX3556369.1 NAD/NADP octopine/nopaline dehydrogenase family protein [Chelatococcus sp.]
MKVAVLGAGAMGLTAAAVLASRGHEPILWSPSGASTHGLTTVTATGALTGEWAIAVASDPSEAVAGADAVLLVVDAAGHRPVMDQVAPVLRQGVPFIISAAHSLSALYLARLLEARGVVVPIVSWNTSPGTAHREAIGHVDIRTVRARIEAAVMPTEAAPEALALCRALLPAQFEERTDALAIALLSNCNPVFHVPVCLLNASRIEHRETWAPYHQTTPAVGRLMEALDGERLAIASAFGIEIHSVNEHFHRSFRVPLGSMAEMNATLHANGRGPRGPMSMAHRYLSQDIPYGIVFASRIAHLAGVASPVHDAVIAIADVMLGKDCSQDNNLLPVLGLEKLTPQGLLQLATDGFRDRPQSSGQRSSGPASLDPQVSR